MSRYLVGIAKYGKDPHVRCFEDVARGLVHALRALGHEVAYATKEAMLERAGRLIMFGMNNAGDPAGFLDADDNAFSDAIIFNTEQVAAVRSVRQLMQNCEKFKDHVVWDYSNANLAVLREAGISRAVHCPVGYVPQMSSIAPAAHEDIDVLFIGSMNARRRDVLDALDALKLRVVRSDRVFEGHKPFGIYGEERDRLIARAKIVLNMHFYEGGIFEIFRVSHLLANRKCVVTEEGGRDAELNAFASRAAWASALGAIPHVCEHLVKSAGVRRAVANRGYDEFKRTNFVENVRRALEQS